MTPPSQLSPWMRFFTQTCLISTRLRAPLFWAQELYNFKDHVPETEEYGITSFVYRARELFDPGKIHNFFNQEWPGVVRAEGFFG